MDKQQFLDEYKKVFNENGKDVFFSLVGSM